MAKDKSEDLLDGRKRRALVSEVLDKDTINDDDLCEGLTDKQQLVLRLKIRGATQNQIAKIMKISQPAVSKMLGRVRDKLAESAKTLDQSVLIGENLFFYQDVEKEILDIKDSMEDPGEQLKAIAQLMGARKDRNKLLMDVGLLTRAPKEVTHRVTSTPLIEKYREGKNLDEVVDIAISPLLDELEEPEPPPLLVAEIDDDEEDQD